MRTVPLLLAMLAAGPALAEHRFAEPLASIYLAEIQAQLADRGYFAGPPTGQADAATIDAIRAWQADAGLPVTGVADPALVDMLRFGLAAAKPPPEPPPSAVAAREAPPLPPAPQPKVLVEPLEQPQTANVAAPAAEEVLDI